MYSQGNTWPQPKAIMKLKLLTNYKNENFKRCLFREIWKWNDTYYTRGAISLFQVPAFSALNKGADFFAAAVGTGNYLLSGTVYQNFYL
jgi:hypothetical protein